MGGRGTPRDRTHPKKENNHHHGIGDASHIIIEEFGFCLCRNFAHIIGNTVDVSWDNLSCSI